MKKSQKQNFLEWNKNAIANSIKRIDFSIIRIIALDLLFYLSAGFLLLFWRQRIEAKMAAINLPSDISALGFESAQQLTGEIKEFYYIVIFSFMLVLLLIILLASIFKGVIWAKTTKTKASFSLISKFLGLNMIWMGAWFLIVFLVAYLVQIQFVRLFMIIALAASIYFTGTLYTIFMKKQKLSSIFDAIKLSITKIHMLAVPYAAVFLIALFIRGIGSLLQFQYSAFVVGFVLVVYAAFARYYVSEFALELDKA